MISENTVNIHEKDICRMLDEFFQPGRYTDLAPNGLLLSNAQVIDKVYTATFSSEEVLGKLRRQGAHDCLLFTHHPGAQHPESEPPVYFSDRDKHYMKENRISHYSMHLPLDQLGPYAPGIALAGEMELTPYSSFFEEGGAMMGMICTGPFQTVQQVLDKTELVVEHKCRLYQYGEENLQDGKIALVAGGCEGADIYEKLRKAGVRLFVTGVGTKEADWFAPSHEAARQQGVSILAAGHYSTEKFALKSVCRFFEERGLKAEFIEETPLLMDL